MKFLMYQIIFLMFVGIAYAGYGDLGYGNCEGGYGVCVAAGGGGASSGGSGFTAGAEASPEAVAAVTSILNQELCELSAGFSWFENTCYVCDGIIIPDEEGLLCKTCNEGFSLVGNQCKAETQIQKFQNVLDKFLNKYFPDDPMFGFIAIITVGVLGVAAFANRKEILLKIKKIFK